MIRCLTIDIGSIRLGRPWLYDNDEYILGKTNICSFVFRNKKISLYCFSRKNKNFSPIPPEATSGRPRLPFKM